MGTEADILVEQLKDEAARKWPDLTLTRDRHGIHVERKPTTATVFPLAAPGVAGLSPGYLTTSLRGAESCDEVIERAEALAQVMRCVRWLLAEGKARGGELWR